jgi:N-carbamoylputrescine amidase
MGTTGDAAHGTIRAAVIQTGPATGSLEENLARAGALARAVDPAPDVCLFPELFARPFWCVGLADPGYLDWAERLDGPTLTAMGDHARGIGCWLVVPFFERGQVEGEFYNSVAVLDPDGRLVEGRLPDGTPCRTFRKHAVSSYHWDGHVNDEKFYFRSGSGLPVFDTDLGTLGILVCYDRWYPEAWRVLALGGATIVFVPNASEGYVSEMFVALIRVSAAQNQVFAVAANRAGRESIGDVETSYYGQSCIAGPRGELLAQANGDPDQVIAAELDPAAVAEARRRLWVYRDRRPDLYGPIVRAGHIP